MKASSLARETIRLGLVGDNIARSQSPRLHRMAGRLCGLDVAYDRLVPADLGQDFDAVFAACGKRGYRGLNVTYPYKERVVSKLVVNDPVLRAMAACNTVVFDAPTPAGFNTDHTGFIAAFRTVFGNAGPGAVAMAGTGGVGRAIGFALGRLGASELRLFDRDLSKAEALASALASVFQGLRVVIAGTVADAASGADGLVNCTPLGMDGHGGTAIPQSVIGSQSWAFDAVYTPVETAFIRDARAAGLAVMSGYELFFHQGADAFDIFTRCKVDREALRQELLKSDPASDEE
ncbi:shikimate dehydrogenase family protein [Nitratireductor sp. GCM10026969]|uniref:shikimate dehydrogenase family protein n=1 Tax=Nitratireductor sp. GCM10026969 TaxID=3252645 RepID=UPI0036132C3F